MDLETFFTVSEQTKLFLMSCLLGIPIGIVFDIFRVIRVILPHNKISVAIEDILFMFIYATFVMTFTIVAARGEFRVFYIIGNFCGFTIYFFTVGTVVIGIFRKLIEITYKIISKIFEVIYKVLMKILFPFIRLFVFIYKKLSSIFVRLFKNMPLKKKISK